MNDLQIATDLRGSAAYLRKYGWAQHAYGEDGGPRCAIGALKSATGTSLVPDHVVALGFARDMDEYVFRGIPALSNWNDEPARTAEEVIDRLESTALALEVRALAAEALVETVRDGQSKPISELVAV